MHSHLSKAHLVTLCKEGLNPCCNGRCTRTSVKETRAFTPEEVLILVVMEDALAHPAGGLLDEEDLQS